MPTSYRVEYAKTNRAGCTYPTCKRDKVKMEKGSLKFGSWVDIPEGHSFWSYRHWGCVTPKQLEHLKEFIEGDFDVIDGLEELSEEDQKRVRKAVEEGHIADEECIGMDPEINRPGAAEAKKEAEKQAKKAEKKALKAQEKVAKQAEKERAKAEKGAAQGDTKAKKAPAKIRNGIKKEEELSGEDGDDGREADIIAHDEPKKRSRVKDGGAKGASPPAKRSRATKPKQTVKTEAAPATAQLGDPTETAEDESEAVVEAPAAKKGRVTKTAKESATKNVASAGTRKSGRTRKN